MVENDFFKPTHPTKVWKIPYFFLKASLSVLTSFRVKNNFFQNYSKLPKNIFWTIKISFFSPDFLQLQGWVGRSDQIWKIPDYFFLIDPFPRQKAILEDFFFWSKKCQMAGAKFIPTQRFKLLKISLNSTHLCTLSVNVSSAEISV